jgi:hypothetical protein
LVALLSGLRGGEDLDPAAAVDRLGAARLGRIDTGIRERRPAGVAARPAQ